MIQSIEFSLPQNIASHEEGSSDLITQKKLPSFMNQDTSANDNNISFNTTEKIETEILSDKNNGQENNSSQVIEVSKDVKKNNTLIFDDSNFDTYFQNPDSNVGKKASITGLVSNIFSTKNRY